ncbi:MAG: endonuclease/exonuclease/phosphatase family protein [Nannocystaceae bacterium]|nr:endonuclease/exonuclease/phosphatase family protein [Nannocystaceae bacterium]
MRRIRSAAFVSVSLVTGCLSPDVSLPEGATEVGTGTGTSGAEETSSGPASSSSTADSASVGDVTTTFEPTTGEDSECADTPLRVATFNIEAVSSPGSDPFIGLAASIARMGADVVCMQEVNEGEDGWVSELGTAAGYSVVVLADPSPAIGGDIFNACMSRIPMELIASYGGSALSSDPNANDVGRDILAVRVQPEPGCYAALFTVHLKSGGDYEDLFRRQVEAERLARAVRLYRENRPADGLIVLGDFNEQLDDADLGTTLDEVPPLPSSYELGSDIDVPLRYHPFEVLTSQGFQIAPAFQEDSANDGTFIGGNFNSRLDYVIYGQALFEGAEVYNACSDNGEDDDPPGGWLPKEGEPLACYSTQIASDHLSVFADFVLP